MNINKKLGYYICDGKIFESKIAACIHGHQNKQPVEWVFNNVEFSNYNWLEEPNETLDELYDKRSKQLRETYDYIIISYSAGADSHNIVESFLRQGLRIDEIVVNTMESASKSHTNVNENDKRASNAGAEYYLQTVPRLKEITSRSPETKISVIDMSENLFSDLENFKDPSWVYDKRESLHPANITRFNYLHYKDLRKSLDKSKSVGIILGVEKPRTFIYNNNKFYIRFIDKAANVLSVADHYSQYDNCSIEYFYWSPDSLDILCKQSHVIKKWLEANPEKQELWRYENITVETVKLVHERLLRDLIYTTWNTDWYQADKAVKEWYSEFDQWFIDGFNDTKSFQIWSEGLQHVYDNAGDFVVHYKDKPDGLRYYFSYYCLGPMKFTNQ